MLEDSFSKSRAVAPDSVVDSWQCNLLRSSPFLILVTAMAPNSAPAALVFTGLISGQPDITVLTFKSDDVFESGPHRVDVVSDCTRMELRALPAENPLQVSCVISYVVKWL